MAKFMRKIPVQVDAYPTSTGGYVVIETDDAGQQIAVPYDKKSFEDNFEPWKSPAPLSQG